MLRVKEQEMVETVGKVETVGNKFQAGRCQLYNGMMRFTKMELKEQDDRIRLLTMAILVETEEILEELEQVGVEETQEYCKLQ